MAVMCSSMAACEATAGDPGLVDEADSSPDGVELLVRKELSTVSYSGWMMNGVSPGVPLS